MLENVSLGRRAGASRVSDKWCLRRKVQNSGRPYHSEKVDFQRLNPLCITAQDDAFGSSSIG